MWVSSEKKKRTGRNFKRAAGMGCAAIALVAFGCAETPKDTRAADETTIRALDAQWAKSAAAKDVDATVGYYADDASLLAPNAAIASDKASIRAAWSGLLGPDASLNWQASKVEVARSSDLAYIQGVYQLSMKDAHGKAEMDRGKFVEVWKKQADGNWKVVEDIFNTDLPVAAPAAVERKSGRRTHPAKKRHGHSRNSGA